MGRGIRCRGIECLGAAGSEGSSGSTGQGGLSAVEGRAPYMSCPGLRRPWGWVRAWTSAALQGIFRIADRPREPDQQADRRAMFIPSDCPLLYLEGGRCVAMQGNECGVTAYWEAECKNIWADPYS